MFSNTLTDLLKSLNPEEFQRLGLYLQSPYFNKNDKILSLYNLAKKAHPDFENVKTSKEKAAKKLFADNKKPHLAYRRLLASFGDLVEGFLAHERLVNNKLLMLNTLREDLYERRLYSLYEKAFKACKDMLNLKEMPSSEYYYNEFNLNDEWTSYLAGLQNRSKKVDYQVLLNKLEVHYAVNKLQMCCMLKNHQNILSANYNILLLDELLKAVRENDFLSENPIIDLYAAMYNFISNEEVEHYFFEFLTRLSPPPKIMRAELDIFYITSINYCIRKYRNGKKPFMKYAYELYQNMIDNELLIKNNELVTNDYINIIVAAVKSDHVNNAATFAEEYKQHLPADVREKVYSYCKAVIAFHREDYEEVLELLTDIKTEDQFSKANSELLIIKSYYELREFRALESRQESFRIYLHRKDDISNDLMQGYQNTNNFIKRLHRLHLSLERVVRNGKGDERLKEDVAKLVEDFSSTSPIASQMWLGEKIEQFAHEVNSKF